MAGVGGRSFQLWHLLRTRQRQRQMGVTWKRGNLMRMLRPSLLLKVCKPETPALARIV